MRQQMHIHANALQYNSGGMIIYQDSYEYLMETNKHELFCLRLNKQLFCCRKNVYASWEEYFRLHQLEIQWALVSLSFH